MDRAARSTRPSTRDSSRPQGAEYTQGILEALTADPKVWAKTLLILTYDENGGFFDHVPPPTPPPGTPGEELSAGGLRSPRRRPASPARSGLASACRRCSSRRSPAAATCAATRSTTRRCSGCWRRASAPRCRTSRSGAATRAATSPSAIPFGCAPDLTIPTLPDAAELLAAAIDQCGSLPQPTLPEEQVMPKQEPGARPRVGAGCARAHPIVRPPTTPSALPLRPVGERPRRRRGERSGLPLTGGTNPGLAAAAATAALALALRRFHQVARTADA